MCMPMVAQCALEVNELGHMDVFSVDVVCSVVCEAQRYLVFVLVGWHCRLAPQVAWL